MCNVMICKTEWTDLFVEVTFSSSSTAESTAPPSVLMLEIHHQKDILKRSLKEVEKVYK